jgi:hypothetical protein
VPGASPHLLSEGPEGPRRLPGGPGDVQLLRHSSPTLPSGFPRPYLAAEYLAERPAKLLVNRFPSALCNEYNGLLAVLLFNHPSTIGSRAFFIELQMEKSRG